MPAISLSKMPDTELVRLINAASAELARRITQPRAEPAGSVAASARDPQMAALLSEPEPADADFCLMIAARIRAGGYVKASERERVAEIATSYQLWVSRQGLPTGRGAGDWKRAASYASAARAKSR